MTGSPSNPHTSDESVSKSGVKQRVRQWLRLADDSRAAYGCRLVLSDSLQVRVTTLSLTIGELRALVEEDVSVQIRESLTDEETGAKAIHLGADL